MYSESKAMTFSCNGASPTAISKFETKSQVTDFIEVLYTNQEALLPPACVAASAGGNGASPGAFARR
ncbi:hypothetical protein SFA35_01310 [Pseudomonas sp. HR96]|uniref:hypothetical protein n=1 Tax=Pseudomonas sp. HR96 TaxID=1027966 RepID=UPI002A7654F1|nr:hypothetical protein [Pseudomonas sp. HR96]WPP00055.1 hypothetical protein SFA35_01310 [Pseudomonas sp. HR96]